MGEWKEVCLADVIDVKHGYAFPGNGIKEQPPGDILLTPGNFAIGGGFKSDKFKYFRGLFPNEYILQENDLIVTMTDLSKQSDTLGYPALVPKPKYSKYLHNQRLGKVLVREGAQVDMLFLSYLLRTPEYRHEVLASATGTTVKHTSPSRILKFKTSIPIDVTEQRAIAHILGTLDDKIELNRRMNETLEAMALALFKSWFVDFEPVRAKAEGRDTGLPKDIAELFPDSFEDSELGEVPKGWRVGKFGDVAEQQRRSIQSDAIRPETPYIGLEHMPRRCIALSEWGCADFLESNKYEFKQGEILFGKLRPYFHKVGVSAIDGVCSTDIVVVTPKTKDWLGLVLGHISSTEFVEYTTAGSTGTKMPRTSWQEMSRYPLFLPPKTIATEFTKMCEPSVERIAANIHQSRTLATLRDTLLPKLLSGEIRVKDAEKIAEETL